MSILELSLVLLVIGLFALIVLLMIRGEKRTQARKEARARKLGLRPLAEVPSSIQQRINWLYTHSNTQKLELRNLAALEHSDHTLFIFGLVDLGGDGESSLQDDAILVTSSELSLPRFTMMTKVSQAGILAEWANKAIQSFVERRGHHPIKLRDPVSADRFLVLSEDPAQTASFFDRISLSASPQSSYTSIEAGGDAFIYSSLPFPSQRQSPLESLELRMREAEQWFRLFLNAAD
jgi:hypothetical protein